MTSSIRKRREKRIPVHLHAMFVIDGKSYNGLIQNLSLDGAGSSIVSSLEIGNDFAPSRVLEVDLKLPSGDSMHLETELIWFLKDGQNNAVLNVGMRVVDPPQKYMEFVQGLYKDALENKTKEQLVLQLLESQNKIAELETLVVKLRGLHTHEK